MAFRCLHGFEGHFGSCRGERAENAASVKPARAALPKDLVPINITRLQLRNGGVAAIVTSQGGAHAEAALGEIEAVASGVAYAIMLDPSDQRLVDAALVDEILKEPANGIIGEGGDDSGVQSETALESSSDVVFAAAFADFEGTRRGDTAVAWVKTEHDLAEADDVPAAIFLRFDRQAHVVTSTARSIGNGCRSIVTVLKQNFQNHVCV